MVLTLAVVGMISIAVPALKDWSPKTRARNAAWTLAADLMWARSRAITEGNPFIVAFDSETATYRIYDDNAGDGIGEGDLVRTRRLADFGGGIVFGAVPGGGIDGTPVAAGVAMGTTTAPVREVFAASGRPRYSGAAYLVPADDLAHGRADRAAAVGVYGTGKVRVYVRGPEGWK
jgi:hypothetical protein